MRAGRHMEAKMRSSPAFGGEIETRCELIQWRRVSPPRKHHRKQYSLVGEHNWKAAGDKSAASAAAAVSAEPTAASAAFAAVAAATTAATAVEGWVGKGSGSDNSSDSGSCRNISGCDSGRWQLVAVEAAPSRKSCCS